MRGRKAGRVGPDGHSGQMRPRCALEGVTGGGGTSLPLLSPAHRLVGDGCWELPDLRCPHPHSLGRTGVPSQGEPGTPTRPALCPGVFPPGRGSALRSRSGALCPPRPPGVVLLGHSGAWLCTPAAPPLCYTWAWTHDVWAPGPGGPPQGQELQEGQPPEDWTEGGASDLRMGPPGPTCTWSCLLGAAAGAAQAGSRVTPHLASFWKAGVPGPQEIHVSVCRGREFPPEGCSSPEPCAHECGLTGDKAFVEIIKTSVTGQ